MREQPERKKVLFLVPSSFEQAVTRYRVLQYLPALNAAGFITEVAPFLTPELERRLYQPGIGVAKVVQIMGAGFRRMTTALSAHSFDIVVICREAMLYGPPFLEWWIGRVGRRPIVFDYDDAVYVGYDSPTYGRMAKWIKCPWKTDWIIRMSTHVLAASPVLVEHARQLHSEVTFLPTAVDIAQYQSTSPWPRSDPRPVIGWIGSHSTAQYLRLIVPALQELARRHSFVFRVIGACARTSIPEVEVEEREWNQEDEIKHFRSFDVGVYPIFDDEWARGKAAFKAIQYMAAGVPCICSPVGMTCNVVEHGKTGLLARTTEEWVYGLEALLTDSSMAKGLAANALAHVTRHYSLAAHAPRLIAVLRKISALGK